MSWESDFGGYLEAGFGNEISLLAYWSHGFVTFFGYSCLSVSNSSFAQLDWVGAKQPKYGLVEVADVQFIDYASPVASPALSAIDHVVFGVAWLVSAEASLGVNAPIFPAALGAKSRFLVSVVDYSEET